MSTKIELQFKSSPDLELLEKGIHVDIVRILCRARFLGRDTWSDPEIAIVDTGAPVSLLPADIWKNSQVKILASTVITGLIPRKECIMEVDIAEVSVRLLDKNNESEPMRIRAYLAPTNRIPIILGIDSLLTDSDVSFNVSKSQGYILINRSVSK
jgi:hypothetical protein